MALNEPDWENLFRLQKLSFPEWLFNRSVPATKDLFRRTWERGFGYQLLILNTGLLLALIPVIILLKRRQEER